MKLDRLNIQKTLLFLFIIALPLDKRHIFFSFSRGSTLITSDFLNISVYLSDLLLLALLLASIPVKNYSTWWNSIKNVEKSYILLIIWSFISILYTFLPREAFNWFSLLKLVELLILSMFIAKIAQNRGFRHVAAFGLIMSGLIQALLAISQFVLQRSLNLFVIGEPTINRFLAGIAKIDLNGDKYIRAYGTFGHPNELAAFLVVACATTIYMLLITENKKIRIFYLFTISAIILGIFVSFSRAGLAALMIFLIIIIAALAKQNKKTQNISLCPIVLILFASIIFFSAILFPYLKARVSPAPTGFSRTLYNKTGWQIFKASPIMGVGLGNIIPAMAGSINYTETWQIQPPHIYLLIVACETGIIGLGIVVYILATRLAGLIKGLWLGDKEQIYFKIILLGSFTSILLLMFFDHYFYTAQQTQLLLWLVIGMISGQIKTKNA